MSAKSEDMIKEINKEGLNIRCKNSFHCYRCFQPENNRKYFIFIEHTPHCRSRKCDIPCIAQKRKKQSIMSVSLVQNIINEIANSKYNVVLYGLGSSDFPYHKLKLPTSNSFQTTITNSYKHYSEYKSVNQNMLLFARVYSFRDINEVVDLGNYNGVKVVICNNKNNGEYVEMAITADENNLSIVFDYDHISENVNKLNEILLSVGECKNVSYRGKCNGTKPIVIMNWSDLYVTYREEFHYFETVKTVSKNEFLKLVL